MSTATVWPHAASLRSADAVTGVVASRAIAIEEFESGWFAQHGSQGRAHALFGERLAPLPAELNTTLAAWRRPLARVAQRLSP